MKCELLLAVAVLSSGCSSVFLKREFRDLAAKYDVPADAPVEIVPRPTGLFVMKDPQTGEEDVVESTGLEVDIVNRTDGVITVEWDRCAIVIPSGTTERAMHVGVKYADRNQSQPPSVIAPRSRISESITPTSSILEPSVLNRGWRAAPFIREGQQLRLLLAVGTQAGIVQTIIIPVSTPQPATAPARPAVSGRKATSPPPKRVRVPGEPMFGD